MSISGVGQNYYQNNMTTTKSTKNINSTEKFALEKTSGTQELSEAEEMELFKKEFYEELSKIKIDRHNINVAINISEDAFKKMKEDPQYKQQILNLLKRDLGSSLPANYSAVFTIGSSIKDYRGDAYPVGYDSEFYARSQNSFYKKTSEHKDRQKELLEEYLEKRAQTKRLQEKLMNEEVAEKKLEHNRMMKSWYSESHVTQASAAYEANVLAEPIKQ